VRIVAASNRRLEDEVRAGRFREDLFFRLNLIALDVPPLRARAGDVNVLSQHFLDECARRYQLPGKWLPVQSLRRLGEYPWPGNVRELENLIHRAYLLCDDEQLDIEIPGAALAAAGADVPIHHKRVSMAAPEAMTYRSAKNHALQEFDRDYLTRLLQRTEGNVTQAAQLAGKERRALGKLLKRYGIGYESAPADSPG
jgi:DNA-binding NtrC family response regulator